MASFDMILVPAQTGATKLAALAASTSSAEQALGKYEIFAINADQDITIKFGVAGLGAAAATDFRIPQNSTIVFDLGNQYTSFRVFNMSGTTAANVYYMKLVKF